MAKLPEKNSDQPEKRLTHIGVVFPHGVEFAARMLTGVIRFADLFDDVRVTEYFHHYEATTNPVRTIDEIDGVICWKDLRSDWLEEFMTSGVKVVNCNFDWKGVSGIVSVGNDVEMSCRMIVNHATQLHFKQLAVIGVNLDQRPSSAEMCAEMTAQAKQLGLSTYLHEIVGIHPDEKRSRIEHVERETELLDFLSSLPKPTYLWCENDFIARMATNSAALLGIDVPHQLAVVGRGDYHISVSSHPHLTTLPRPGEQTGFTAAQVLKDWVENDSGQPSDVLIPPAHLILRSSSEVDSKISAFIYEVNQLIQDEACIGLTVESVCDRFGVSKVQLTKNYTHYFGHTPGHAIRVRKTEVAQNLLAESEKSISEISQIIGYSEQSKFSKFFKRQTSMTPSEYRTSFSNL